MGRSACSTGTTNKFHQSVVVIDGSNNSVIATAGESNNPVGVQGLAINKTTNTIYAASSAKVFVLNGHITSFRALAFTSDTDQ